MKVEANNPNSTPKQKNEIWRFLHLIDPTIYKDMKNTKKEPNPKQACLIKYNNKLNKIYFLFTKPTFNKFWNYKLLYDLFSLKSFVPNKSSLIHPTTDSTGTHKIHERISSILRILQNNLLKISVINKRLLNHIWPSLYNSTVIKYKRIYKEMRLEQSISVSWSFTQQYR